MSNVGASESLTYATKPNARYRIERKATPGVPVKPGPATNLQPRRPPERGDLARLHEPVTGKDVDIAVMTLRAQRNLLAEEIEKKPSFRDNQGKHLVKHAWKLAVMRVRSNGSLRELNPSRRNDHYRSVEEMSAKAARKKSPHGTSGLRYQAQRSTDPRASGTAQERRRVGGQHVGMLEGDIEEAALREAHDEVEDEFEGLFGGW